MSEPPTKSRPGGSTAPRRPFQFSLRTLFLGMLTLCVVLGIGYTTAAIEGYVEAGILAGSIAAVIAAIIWTAVLTRSWTHTLVRSLYLLVIGLLVVALLPPMNMVRSGRKVSCPSNLRQVTTALLLYERNHGQLPPAYTIDAQGNRLHSWRTLILPYLEFGHVYDLADLSQPWDAAVNQQVRNLDMYIYQCAAHPQAGKNPSFTSYVAVVGPETDVAGRNWSAAERGGRRFGQHALDRRICRQRYRLGRAA